MKLELDRAIVGGNHCRVSGFQIHTGHSGGKPHYRFDRGRGTGTYQFVHPPLVDDPNLAHQFDYSRFVYLGDQCRPVLGDGSAGGRL